MANPNPKTEHLEATRWKPGQTGNPGGRPKGSGRDIQALDKLIAELDAEPGIAKTWLKEALGQAETVVETHHPDGTITRKVTRKAIQPNFAFFRMLIEYRNGKVKDETALTINDGTQELRDFLAEDEPEAKPEA